MKLKRIVFFATAFVFLITSCKEEKKEVAAPVVEVDLIYDNFPEEEREVMAFMQELKQTILNGEVEKLISYHAYGPKFTEFNAGAKRVGSIENEKTERSIFGNVTEIVKFDFNDLKIAVYDQVANVTFHSDFQLMFGEDLVVVKDQITLLLVKTESGWKFVHEHHSPLKTEEETT